MYLHMPGLWGLKHVAIKSNDVDSNTFSSIEVEISLRFWCKNIPKKWKIHRHKLIVLLWWEIL